MSLFAITGIPILLTGAALVGLPILLHLIMRQEPRRLTFPAFRFLKQRRQINQRKIRLRHLLLLLLRMGLIALICLSLFQPTVLSEGFSLRGGRPVAAVLLIDTSPSMGYILASDRKGLTEGRKRGLELLGEPADDSPWTGLDEARGRAMEVLEDLPPGSRVAVIDPADRQSGWALSLDEARQRVRDLKKPKANAHPVTRALEWAYDLLAKADADREPGQEPFPRFLAVFSDRTATSWDVERKAELQSARDRVQVGVNHAYVDVGVEKPLNAAITAVGMKPQIIPANQPVVVDVVVEATAAGAQNNILVFTVNGEEQKLAVSPSPDRPVVTQFRKDGLEPGLYHAKVSLKTDDGLPFDNEHFLTFRVRDPRRILVLVDYPVPYPLALVLGWTASLDDRASLWKLALESTRWYAVDVRPASDLDRPPARAGLDLSKYALVTLMGLDSPSKQVWTALDGYVRGHGKVIVVPGGREMNAAAYRSAEAQAVLPRPYAAWNPVADERGVTWTWRALNPGRPFLRRFIEYQKQTDFFDARPPAVRGFWTVEGAAADRVVVAYNDSPDEKTRSPAVLTLNTGDDRDAVLQFTTPLGPGSEVPHPYAESWFYLVLANEAVRSMTGDSEDAVFNYANGEFVPAHWPAGAAATTYYLGGPDVAPADAVLNRDGNATTLYLPADRTVAAGSFTVTAEDQSWKDGFSLNPPARESDLRRVEAAEVEDVFGPGTVYPADKALTLADILSGTFTQPIDLYPFLLILLLMVLVVENLLSNKFYRRKPGV